MGRARAASIQHDRVVQHASVAVLEGVQPFEEVRQLLAEKVIVASEMLLAVLVGRVGQLVMGLRQAQLEGEGVADAHAVLAVEHEGHGPRDVGVERQPDQVEHRPVVFGGLALGCRAQVQMRVVLLLQRHVDPAFGSDQPGFHLVQGRQVLVHAFPVRFTELAV